MSYSYLMMEAKKVDTAIEYVNLSAEIKYMYFLGQCRSSTVFIVAAITTIHVVTGIARAHHGPSLVYN